MTRAPTARRVRRARPARYRPGGPPRHSEAEPGRLQAGDTLTLAIHPNRPHRSRGHLGEIEPHRPLTHQPASTQKARICTVRSLMSVGQAGRRSAGTRAGCHSYSTARRSQYQACCAAVNPAGHVHAVVRFGRGQAGRRGDARRRGPRRRSARVRSASRRSASGGFSAEPRRRSASRSEAPGRLACSSAADSSARPDPGPLSRQSSGVSSVSGVTPLKLQSHAA